MTCSCSSTPCSLSTPFTYNPRANGPPSRCESRIDRGHKALALRRPRAAADPPSPQRRKTQREAPHAAARPVAGCDSRQQKKRARQCLLKALPSPFALAVAPSLEAGNACSMEDRRAGSDGRLSPTVHPTMPRQPPPYRSPRTEHPQDGWARRAGAHLHPGRFRRCSRLPSLETLPFLRLAPAPGGPGGCFTGRDLAKA